MIRSVLINIPNNSTPSNTYNRLYAIDDVLYWAGTTLITATSAAGYFSNYGNSFGATAVLGTNDNYGLQLEANGTTRFTIATSGNIGIGTINPNYSLDVYGSFRVYGDGNHTYFRLLSGASNRESKMLFGNSAERFNVGLGSSNNNFVINSSNGGTPTSINIDYNTGFVGIGIATPTASLHVVGDGYITNNLIVGNLTVVGTTSTINSTNLSIKDAIIELNTGQIGANPLYDSGFIINRGLGGSGSGANVGFIWNENTDRFLLLGTNLTASATTVTYSNFEDLQYRNSFIQYQQIIASSSATGSVAFNIRNNVGSNIFNVNHNGDVRVGIVNYNQNDGIFSIYGDGTHPSNVIFSVRSATNGLGLYVTNLGHVNIGGNQILYHSNYYQYGSGSDYTLRARTNGALTLASNDITRLTIGSSGTFTFHSLTGTQSDLVFIDLNGVIGRTSSSTFLSGNYFAQDGNSFGDIAILGSNDNILKLRSGGYNNFIMATTGQVVFGSGYANGALTPDLNSQLFINSNMGGWNNSAMKIWYSSTDTVLGEVSALAHRNGNWTSLYVNGTGSSLTHTIYTEGNKPIIFNSGNIGVNIGATSPTASLLIYGNNSQSILNLQNNTSGSSIDFGSSSGTITIDNNSSNGTTFIARRKTAPTTRFVSMDTNGRLIIKSFHTEGSPSTNSALEVYHFGAVNSTSQKYTSIINSNITSTGTAATGDFSVLHFTGTYNQLGGAAHNIHGIYYNPTIGSVSGTHYFLRSTSGDILAQNGIYDFYGSNTNNSSILRVFGSTITSGNSNVGIVNIVSSVVDANNIIMSNWTSNSINNYTGIAFIERQVGGSILPSARIRSRYYDSNNNGELAFYTALTGSDTYIGAFKDKRFYIGNYTNSSQINATLNVISYTTASNSYLATFRNSLLTNILVIADDGKIGINTTTLTNTLNISGDLRVLNTGTFAAIKTGAYAESPMPLETSPNTIVGNAYGTTVTSPTISNYGQLGVYGIGGGNTGGRWNIGVMGYQNFNQNFGGNSNNTGIGGYFLAKGAGGVTDFNGSYIGIHAEGNIGADTSGTYSGGNIYGVKAYAFGNGTTTTYGLYTYATNGLNNYAIYSATGYNYLADITGVGTISASYRLSVLNNMSLRAVTTAEFDYLASSNIGRISLGSTAFNITSVNNSIPIVFNNQFGEIARLNSNRNLLIGTTSNLGSRLIVEGNITSISDIQAFSATGISRIYTGESLNSTSGNSVVMETDGATNKARLYANGLSTNLELHSIGVGSNVLMSSYNNLVFQTNNNGLFGGTTRMTILATSGNVGIGTTAPIYMLDVVSAATISARFDGRVIGSTAVNSNEYVTLGQITASASTGYFLQNGNSFGATAMLGTNDNYPLAFEVNSVTSLILGTNGFLTIGTIGSNNYLRSNLSNRNNIILLESSILHNSTFATYSPINLNGTIYAFTQSSVNNIFFNLQPTLITTTNSQIQTAFSIRATFTGSNIGTNIIADFSSQYGSMFSVLDGITGSIFNVNDITGFPIINATSDWDFNISDYPDYVFTKQNKNLYLGVTGSSVSTIVMRSDVILNEGLGFTHRTNQVAATTSDTTPTIIWNNTLIGTQSILIDVKINAISNNSNADCLIGEIKATYKKNSATTSVVGKPYKFLNTDNELVDLNFGLSNSTINLNVIGAAAETYGWRATITTQIY